MSRMESSISTKNCTRLRSKAASPLMFESDEEALDDDPAVGSNQQNANEQDDSASELTKEEKILKGFQTVLMGIPPPPAFTVPQLDFREILKLWKDNEEFRVTTSPGGGKQKMATQQQEELKTTQWPEVLTVDHWDIYYNKSAVCEEVERLSLRYKERYVGSETSSCINALFTKSPSRTASARKRARTRAWGHSPGRRLSHLARRRKAFSSANLYSVAGNKNPDKKMIMVEIKKIGNRQKKKGSTKKSKPTPKKKSQTPTATHKRALFQSPDQLPAKNETQTPNTRCVLRSKRNLFADSSCDKLNENGKRERPVPKRTSPRKRVNRSLSFQDHSQDTVSRLKTSLPQLNLPPAQPPQNVLTATHKQKMLWAVTNALRDEHMGMNHELFRPCMTVLFKACQKLWLAKAEIREQKGSTSENMLALAKQFSAYTVKQIKSDPTSEHMVLVCTNIIKQAENTLSQSKPKQGSARQSISRNLLPELSCSMLNSGDDSNLECSFKFENKLRNSECDRNHAVKIDRVNRQSPSKGHCQTSFRILRSTPNKNSSAIQSRTPKKTPSKLASKCSESPTTSRRLANKTTVNAEIIPCNKKTPSKLTTKCTESPTTSRRMANKTIANAEIIPCNKKTPSKLKSIDIPMDVDINDVDSEEKNSSKKKTPSKSNLKTTDTPKKTIHNIKPTSFFLDIGLDADDLETDLCSKTTPSKPSLQLTGTHKKNIRCTQSISSDLESLNANQCDRSTPLKSNINSICTPKKYTRCTRSISSDIDPSSVVDSSKKNSSQKRNQLKCSESTNISSCIGKSMLSDCEINSVDKNLESEEHSCKTPLISILKLTATPKKSVSFKSTSTDLERNTDNSETNSCEKNTLSKPVITATCSPKISSQKTRSKSFNVEAKNKLLESETSSTAKLVNCKGSPNATGRITRRNTPNKAITPLQIPEKCDLKFKQASSVSNQINRKIFFDEDTKTSPNELELPDCEATSSDASIKNKALPKKTVYKTRRASCNTEVHNSPRTNLLHKRSPPKVYDGLLKHSSRKTRSMSCDAPVNFNSLTKPVYLFSKPSSPKGNLNSKNSPLGRRKSCDKMSESAPTPYNPIQNNPNGSNQLLPVSPELTSPITRSRCVSKRVLNEEIKNPLTFSFYTEQSVPSHVSQKCSTSHAQNDLISSVKNSPSSIKFKSEKTSNQRTNSSDDETTPSRCENNKENLDITVCNESFRNCSSQRLLFSVENTPQNQLVRTEPKNRTLQLYKLSNTSSENVETVNSALLLADEPPKLVPHWDSLCNIQSEETCSSLQSPPSLQPHWEQPSSGTSTSLPESIMSHWQQMTTSINPSEKMMFDLEDTSFEITFPSANDDSRASSTCVPFDFPHLIDDSKSCFNINFRKNSTDSSN